MKNLSNKLLLTGTLLGGAMGLNGVNAQQYDNWMRWPLPTERINFFTPQGDEPKTLEFLSLKTDSERRAFGAVQMFNDIVAKIPGSGDLRWSCNTASLLYSLNGNLTSWLSNMLYAGSQIYGGYSGENYDTIYNTRGTNKFFRTTGLPTIDVEIDSYGTGHQFNGFMAGDSVTSAKQWCFQEVPPPWNNTDLQPGQAYLPMNTDYFMIYYSYTYKDSQGNDNFAGAPALLFKLENGIYTFVEKSPYLDIIMTRESDPPVLDLYSSSNGFYWKVTDKNFKKGWYTVDGDIPVSIAQPSGYGSLNLPAGQHKVVFFAEDYFRLVTKDSISFSVPTAIPIIKSLNDLIAYPNPAHDFITVRCSLTSPAAIAEIVGSNGQTMRQFKLDFGAGPFEERLDISGLTPGDYMLRVKTVLPDGNVREDIEKIIKVR